MNVHPVERGLRVVLGAIFSLMGAYTGEWMFAVPAAAMLFSGVVGWCPFYTALHFSTK